MTRRARLVALVALLVAAIVGLLALLGRVPSSAAGAFILCGAALAGFCVDAALDTIDALLEENRLLRRLPPSRR